MASAAAQLLDVPSVKLYQDSLFHKRQGDGATPWHSDARMAPFDTSHLITFWIPLQTIPRGGSALVFVDKSHSDFALPYWNGFEGDEYHRLEERYGGEKAVRDHMPLQLGDVTVHAGWTLHCASGCDDHDDRYALAISYVDAKAEVRRDVNYNSGTGGNYGDNEDRQSFEYWIGDVKPRCQ
eukprot:CAMPEP_0172509058 /NCGR_PEP_ID=MMETSP1066-20121228/217264_1 /TAXON_ID=671091 /ORGANISM="Coscinodiscus wailesii, Strain CCMP2513" /LENGTH=180 /DNA_ID=CAMNT_0013287367 /DNA_START=217 /DNA_END=756 /DNA_ORIENTATION=+